MWELLHHAHTVFAPWQLLLYWAGAARGAVSARRAQYMLTLKVAGLWPVCFVCDGWVMLLVCMGKTHFGRIIWGEVVIMHAQKFPISMYFLRVPAYLPKGCTLH